MSSVHHYKSNLRDTLFNLFEVFRVQDSSLGKGPFAGMDEETATSSLRALEALAKTELAASFADSDRRGVELDAHGDVKLPDSMTRAMRAYHDGEWHRFELPEHLGGYGAPPSVFWAAFEFVVGANPVIAFYLFGSVGARVIDRLGTDDQKRRFALPMIDRRWGGTMALTEPDAGSDVGAGLTKARPVSGDVWELEGTKRFITNGEFDYPENIVHLVLARPEGAGGGTKGLSMFIVPKFLVNDDGSLGARNGVYATKLEKKMGLKASATCEMVFGDDRGKALGYLVGGKHDGIRQMFHVIEQARMGVGMKSMSTLSTAYLHAREYAKERIQGADLANATDKSAPRVAIIRHPDVRRMLMTQKAFAEGMRALCLFTATVQDQVELEGGHGSSASREADKLNDLLLPLVKGYCSEKAFELLAMSLQCFGGSGYCQDWPHEQYIRDQKIDTLYEGTTHVQSLDLFFRKVARDGGQTLQALLGRVRQTLGDELGGPALAAERRALAQGLDDVEGIFGAMMGKAQESLYHVGLQGNRILASLAELVIGWLLVRQAAVALAKRGAADPSDHAFYDGKIASARFFCETALPGIALARRHVEQSSLALMSMADEAF